MKNCRAVLLCLLLFPAVLLGGWDPLAKAAAALSRNLTLKKDVTVAVLTPPHHDGRVSEGSLLVAERLATYLASDKRIHLIEHHHIEQVLSEHRLSETGVVDQKTASRLGKILGTDIIVTGTLINLKNNQTEVNLRGISTSTGKIVAASRALIDRSWEKYPHYDW